MSVSNKFRNIRLALTGPINSILPELKKVMPNEQVYTPALGTAYAEVFILPNPPSAFSLGATGLDEHTGVMQVSLRYPREGTDFPLLDAADAIETEYQKYIRGQKLTSGGVSVRITSVGIGQATPEGAWFFAPINISYESYIRGQQ